jgi:membrane metallo-endopeptidase-like protein 1
MQASLPEADRHDTSAIYRKLSLSQLQREVPQLNWLEYLSAFLDADVDHNEPVVSYAMPYFIEMGRIIQKTDRRLRSIIIYYNESF